MSKFEGSRSIHRGPLQAPANIDLIFLYISKLYQFQLGTSHWIRGDPMSQIQAPETFHLKMWWC